jgi:hypothetical protein
MDFRFIIFPIHGTFHNFHIELQKWLRLSRGFYGIFLEFSESKNNKNWDDHWENHWDVLWRYTLVGGTTYVLWRYTLVGGTTLKEIGARIFLK